MFLDVPRVIKKQLNVDGYPEVEFGRLASYDLSLVALTRWHRMLWLFVC